MDSSSDIINMEEGGGLGVGNNANGPNSLLSPKLQVDYSKVGFKTKPNMNHNLIVKAQHF